MTVGVPIEIEQKECIKCKRVLKITDFNKDSYRKDGREKLCKQCKREERILSRQNPNKPTLRKKPDIEIPDHLNYCFECEKILPLQDFCKLLTAPKGVANICRSCKQKLRKEVKRVYVESKQCSLCKETKPSSEFCKNWYAADALQSQCKECATKTRKEKYNVDLEKSRELSRNKALNSNRYKAWIRSTICGHRHRGFIISFSREDLYHYAIATPNCEFCGCKLNWELLERKRGVVPNTPTLEDLHYKLEWTSLDDVAIVCHSCNSAKGTRTLEEHIEYLKQIIPKLEELKKTKPNSIQVALSVLSEEVQNDLIIR